ncbi:hypothetical protein TWF696_001828 [Orbilia brochopaga]|uniref:Uncharacterized protein n=1 Tax=Orbilia brochopaga TaxID=3140254 RepID=A0AAV9U635_9PEZI
MSTFTGIPVGTKIIVSLSVASAIALMLVVYLVVRRQRFRGKWGPSEKVIEEVVIFDSKSELDLPRSKRLTISGPLKALELEEEYKRTASRLPPRGAARLHPAMLPIHVASTTNKRGGSVLTNVPTAPFIRPPEEPKPAKIYDRNKGAANISIVKTPGTQPGTTPIPTPAPTAAAKAAQAAAAIPINSPSIYSPIELPADDSPLAFKPLAEQLADISIALNTSLDSPIGSPPDEDSYVRAPRLYSPPSMAYGHPDLPYPPPPPRPKSKTQGRKRSVSMQDASQLMRIPSNASSKRKSMRRGDRSSTQSEWMDTLTVIDDGHDLSSQISAESMSDSELFPHETQSEPELDTRSEPGLDPQPAQASSSQHLLVPKPSTRRNRSPKQLPRNRTLLGGTMNSNTSWNNTAIAEQMASIKYSTKRTKSPQKDVDSDKSDW